MSDRKPNTNLFKAKERKVTRSQDAAHSIASQESADRIAKTAALKAARLAKEATEKPMMGQGNILPKDFTGFEITEQDVAEYLATGKLTRPGIVKTKPK